jgi:putative PIN family toxin of toxin-antitoxin system
MLRVVIDTNVIVSGILSHTGTPVELLNVWRERGFLLQSSPAIVAGVNPVLHYPHLQKKYHLGDEEINRRLRSWNIMPY